MFGLFRALARSGGAIAACLALLGLAFYGIAQMSVILVDDPARGFRILGVFLLFSVAFCFALKWVLRRAIAQALRPVGAAKEATSRLVSIGEEGGKRALRSLGRRMRAAGSVLAWTAGGAARLAWRARRVWPFMRRGRDAESASADVIPLKRNREGR